MSPLCSPKVFFVVIPQADYPSVPFHIGQMEKCGFENEAKKVTNHFPFPIIFESGKKAFYVVQAAFIMDASPSYVYTTLHH